MASAGLEWTVLTWNVQGTKSTDLTRLADVIRAESPDVIALQEVRRSQAETLAGSLAMTHTWAFKHHPFTPLFMDRAEGAAILTPHSLSDDGHAVVSDAGWKRSYKRRIAQWATISRDDASGYRAYNVHLSPHDRSADRIVEASRVAAIADSHGDAPPAIVAGDLNNDGEPPVIDALPGIEHITPGSTNPSDDPQSRLDHVLLPAEARSVSVSVPAGGNDWAELSDHLPVTVRFTLDWVRSDLF